MNRNILYTCAFFIVFLQCARIPIQKVSQVRKLSKIFEFKPISDTTVSMYLDQHKKYVNYANAAKEFYKKRNYEYAWFAKDGMVPRIDMFFNLMNTAEHKIELSDDSLITLYNHIREDTSTVRAQDSLQNLEFRLTLTFFAFADKEWTGSDEKLVQQLEWYIPKKKLKYEDILDSLLKDKNTDLSLFKAPIYSQYDLLKTYLEKYRLIEENGGWPTITGDKKSYKPGDTSRVISQIKQRLFISGELVFGDTSQIYTKALEDAVTAFQRTHGLTEDGKVGAGVLKELNIPVHQYIEQIIVNMERCRWVPYDLKGDYFMINIPEFKLHAYEGSKNVWDMNVVVGKTTNKTVIFNGNLQYIVFNPSWTVTSNIFNKEFLPKLRKNPGYLQNQDMELLKANQPNVLIDPYTVDWSHDEKNYHNYVVRQRPGNNNALGKVKFIFPNQYSIYLHDTPAKALFSQASRSFSHGCIRLERPEELAKYLLRDEQGWDDKALNKVYSSNKEQYHQLKKTVPVFIAYFTSWVDKDGNINFRNDIYGHDAKMAKLLIEKTRI
jgi:murein L,D-transpeptidase YcbB/YkuD